MSQKTRRTTDEEAKGASRRRVLRAIGAGAAAVSIPGAASAQDGGGQGGGGQQQQPDIRLGGEVAAWHGRKPQSIQNTDNPTLNLQAGQTYTLWWKNLDGQPHDFAFRDENGNNLQIIEVEGEDRQRAKTDLIQEQGATQTLQFTPTEAVTQYVCTVHATTMVGEVQIGGQNVIQPGSGGSGGGGGGGGGGGNGGGGGGGGN